MPDAEEEEVDDTTEEEEEEEVGDFSSSPFADRLLSGSVDTRVGAAKEIAEKTYGSSTEVEAFIASCIANRTVLALVHALRATKHDQLRVWCCVGLGNVACNGRAVGGQAACVQAGAPAAIVSALQATEDAVEIATAGGRITATSMMGWGCYALLHLCSDCAGPASTSLACPPPSPLPPTHVPLSLPHPPLLVPRPAPPGLPRPLPPQPTLHLPVVKPVPWMLWKRSRGKEVIMPRCRREMRWRRC